MLFRIAFRSLIFKRAPVDPRSDAVARKVTVGECFPLLAQFVDERAAVAVTLLLLRLGAGKTLRPDLAQRHQHMRVDVARIALRVGRMDHGMRRVSLAHEFVADKIL
jgi:hypothetical protein